MAKERSANARSGARAKTKSRSTKAQDGSQAEAPSKPRATGGKAAASATESRPAAAKRSPKAAARIASILRREIVTGALLPGEMLQPERILQEKFSVSRPTLREAMRLLESESLIRISRGQHGGAHVQKLDTSVTARQVGMYLQMEGTTLADVLEARAFLEPPAAGLIARNRSLDVIEQLRESVRLSKAAHEAGDSRALTEEQSKFSEILTSQSSNNTLALLATLLHDIVLRQLIDLTVHSSSRSGALEMQWKGIRAREKLIRLIEKGDPEEVERYWRLHVEEATKVVASSYRRQMPIDVLQEDY